MKQNDQSVRDSCPSSSAGMFTVLAYSVLVHAFVCSRLDGCNSPLVSVGTRQSATALAASYRECCLSSLHRSQKIRAYHTCSVWSSLATGLTVDYVQVCSSGVQVSTWHGSAVPSVVSWTSVNIQQLAPSIWTLRLTDCSKYQNQLWRLQLRCPRTSGVEQSSCLTAHTRHFTGHV